MNYFYKLLESYSQLKNRSLRLLERDRSGGKRRLSQPPSPQAVYAAKKYIANAKTSNGRQIPVTQLPPAYVTINGKGVVVFTGFPGPRYGREYGIKTAADEDEFARLLDQAAQGGQSSQGATGGEQNQDANGQLKLDPSNPKQNKVEEQPKKTYEFLDSHEFLSEIEYNKTVEKICKIDKTKCKILRGAHARLLNTGNSGDLARTIAQSSYVIESCDENESICVPTRNDQDITHIKRNVSKIFQEIFKILSKEKLTLEDVQYLKQSVSISKVGQIIIRDPITGQGMLFHEDSQYITSLINGMISLHEDPGTEKQLELETDHGNFLRNGNGIGGRGATIRGFFFEDLRNAVILHARCRNLQQDSPESNRCNKKISDLFERWIQNQDKLMEAFQGLIDQYNTEGAVSMDLDDNLSMFFIQTVVNAFGNGKMANAQQAMERFSRVMSRMAYMGVDIRRPMHVMKSAHTVGLGRKADMLEVYSTKESAVKALLSMGFDQATAEKMIIERDISEIECDGTDCKNLSKVYLIGDSLKFSNEAESIDLGQASQSNITAVIDGTYCGKVVKDSPRCRADVERQKKMMKESGVTEQDLNLVKEELSRFQSELDIMKKIPKEVKYFTQKGGVRVFQTAKMREEFLKSTLDYFRKNDIFKGLTQNAIIEIEKMIKFSDEQDWEKVCATIASVIQKRRIQQLVDAKTEDGSPDLKQRRKGLGFVVALALFAGGAADNSMLTVIDAKNRTMYVGEQNKYLQSVRDSISNQDNVKNAQIEVRDGKFILNGVEVTFNGKRADCHIPKSILQQHNSKILSLKERQGLEVA